MNYECNAWGPRVSRWRWDWVLVETARLLLATAVGAGTLAFADTSVAQTPPMGGNYTNVIAIPVEDPEVQAIAGALFEPKGEGPFAAVVYMPVCGGLWPPEERAVERRVVDHLQQKGFVVLIVDPYTARKEYNGVCDEASSADAQTSERIAIRGAHDALAAVTVLAARPDIDRNHIFLLGFSQGALNALVAVDSALPGQIDARVAGVIAYYPYCYEGIDPTVPALVFVGEEDTLTPASLCLAARDKPNLEVVVYPGATHGFAMPGGMVFGGEVFKFDEKATKNAQSRADAFMATQMK